MSKLSLICAVLTPLNIHISSLKVNLGSSSIILILPSLSLYFNHNKERSLAGRQMYTREIFNFFSIEEAVAFVIDTQTLRNNQPSQLNPRERAIILFTWRRKKMPLAVIFTRTLYNIHTSLSNYMVSSSTMPRINTIIQWNGKKEIQEL